MLDQINQVVSGLSQAELLLIAGTLASGLQWILNEIKVSRKGDNFTKKTNVALSFILPFTIAGLEVVLNDGSLLVKGGLAYLATQLVYYTVKAFAAIVAKRQDRVAPTVSNQQF